MNEMERAIWEVHEKRLNDQEVRFSNATNDATKDFTEIKESIKTILNRINEGVSKTQQELLKENKGIEKGIMELKHAVEMNSVNMNNKIDIVEENMKKRMEPLEESNRQRDKIYIWAIVGGFVLGLVGFGTNLVLKKLTDKPDTTAHVQQLKAEPIKKR